MLVLRRTGLPLLGLVFFLAWTVVYVALWAIHPEQAFTGLPDAPRFSDFFYYAVCTALISPPGDIFAASRGARSATMIEMLAAFALLTAYLVELRRLAARDAAPESRGHRARTSARSLSPRPERQTSTSSSLAVERAGERVRALERRDDALRLARAGGTPTSASSSVHGTVLGAARVAERRVLGADARVVEAGGDRVRVGDLAVGVGEDRGARAVQDAAAAGAEARRAGRLDADEAHVGVVDEGVEGADRVRAAADARDDDLGQPALGGEELLARLVADHALEVAHELGVRRGPTHEPIR